MPGSGSNTLGKSRRSGVEIESNERKDRIDRLGPFIGDRCVAMYYERFHTTATSLVELYY